MRAKTVLAIYLLSARTIPEGFGGKICVPVGDCYLDNMK